MYPFILHSSIQKTVFGSILLLTVLIPHPTHAALIDSLRDLFSIETKNTTRRIETSQTAQILEAADVFSSVKGYVVDENSLATLPETFIDEKQVPLVSTYVVREKDTLSSIATMFNVSINTILWSNNLSKKDVIKPGQELVILPVSGVTHVVKKGDTLSGIVKKYKGDLDEVLSFNNITSSDELVVGQSVIIPDGEMVVETPASIKVPTSGTFGVISPVGNTHLDVTGYFTRPVVGGIRTRGIHGWNGVDLANNLGTPIYAAAGGEVVVSKMGGWNGGYGNYIVIKHPNGMQTLYGHLARTSVFAGDRVAKGQVIGTMGSTGKSTGPHLHFEVRGGKNPF